MSSPARRPNRCARAWQAACLLGCVLLAAGAPLGAAAGAEVSREYQIKAAFLFNFTKFVEWPPDHFADAQTPIVIGVAGRDPFGGALAATVAGRAVDGRPIEIVPIASLADLPRVDLLFITATEDKRLIERLEPLNQMGVLTVGESPQFAAAGGAITFVLRDDKVRFDINVAAIESSGLRISSKLLSLASSGGKAP